MTPRRKETKIPSGHPARFYKIVALSFLLMTVVLLVVIVFMSSKRATITITSKSSPIEINRTLEIGESVAPNSIDGAVTTTIINLSRSFNPSGEKHEPGHAGGSVTLHNEGSGDQVLIATTRLLAPEGILFRLQDRAVIPAGGTVEALVLADELGEQGNIGPVERFTIPGLSRSSQEIIYATSDSPMTGGVVTSGILSEDDIRKAEKILLDSAEQEARAKALSLYPDQHYLISIEEIGMPSSSRQVGEEVNEFTMNLNVKAVIVAYSQDELLAWAEDMLMKRAIDQSENIEPSGEMPTVTLQENNDKRAIVNVIYTGIAGINPEGQQLAKDIFYGKTKEEVRKYLLSLEHVHSVDIDFSPAWTRTVPRVEDHLSIIVQHI